MDGFSGVTEIDINPAGVTVRVAEPLIWPEVAVIVVLPIPVLLAKPTVGAEPLIVATPADDEVQFTELVMS